MTGSLSQAPSPKPRGPFGKDSPLWNTSPCVDSCHPYLYREFHTRDRDWRDPDEIRGWREPLRIWMRPARIAPDMNKWFRECSSSQPAWCPSCRARALVLQRLLPLIQRPPGSERCRGKLSRDRSRSRHSLRCRGLLWFCEAPTPAAVTVPRPSHCRTRNIGSPTGPDCAQSVLDRKPPPGRAWRGESIL